MSKKTLAQRVTELEREAQVEADQRAYEASFMQFKDNQVWVSTRTERFVRRNSWLFVTWYTLYPRCGHAGVFRFFSWAAAARFLRKQNYSVKRG